MLARGCSSRAFEFRDVGRPLHLGLPTDLPARCSSSGTSASRNAGESGRGAVGPVVVPTSRAVRRSTAPPRPHRLLAGPGALPPRLIYRGGGAVRFRRRLSGNTSKTQRCIAANASFGKVPAGRRRRCRTWVKLAGGPLEADFTGCRARHHPVDGLTAEDRLSPAYPADWLHHWRSHPPSF